MAHRSSVPSYHGSYATYISYKSWFDLVAAIDTNSPYYSAKTQAIVLRTDKAVIDKPGALKRSAWHIDRE